MSLPLSILFRLHLSGSQHITFLVHINNLPNALLPKQMQFNKIIAGTFLTLGAVVSACQSDNIEIPKSELYTREFIKEFGVVDPNHDWNNAAQGSVTVVTSSPTHVEVLADIKGKRYIFADYRKVTGTQEINFTIPKGISNIIVSLNGREIPTNLGAKVDATTRSRAIWEGGDDKVTITRDPYRLLSEEGVMAFKTHLPENQNNLGKVTQNFSFVANGDFTIYPTYWQTDSYNTIGIYYVDEATNEIVHIPFYTNKIIPIDGTQGNLLYTYGDPSAEDKIPAKEDLPLKDGNQPMDAAALLNNSELIPAEFNNNGLTSFLDFTEEDWKIFKRRYLNKVRAATQHYFNLGPIMDKFDVTYFTNSEYFDWNKTTLFQLTGIQCKAKDATHVDITAISVGPINDWIYPGEVQESHPSGDQEVKGWKSRGIGIHIAEGTKFGMYLRVWYNSDPADKKPSIDNVGTVRLKIGEDGKPEDDGYRRFYSEAKYNDVVGGSQVFGATYMYEAPTGTYRVLGFEDYGDVHDLNDMMFFISSEKPQEIPSVKDEDKIPEKYTYLLAAEDLGGTCDWDFNDLVVGVNVVAKNYVEAQEGVTASHPYQEVTVTPLASGGTLPIYLMYTGKVSTSKDDYDSAVPGNYLIGKEFHSWLSNGGSSSLTPINVGARADSQGEPITFHIPEQDYTLAMHKKYSASEGSNNMGGFWVLVINHEDTSYTPAITDDKGVNLITDIPADKGITKIEAPRPDLNLGNIAPQMLCIGHEWFWPRESQKIHSAYPGEGGFTGWLNNESFTEWYGEGKYEESLVTKRDL